MCVSVERLKMREITSERIHTTIKITISEEMRFGQEEVGRVRMVRGDFCFVLLTFFNR